MAETASASQILDVRNLRIEAAVRAVELRTSGEIVPFDVAA